MTTDAPSVGPGPDAPPALAEYFAVRARVDEFAANAEAAQAQWLACGRGCDACCRVSRTAFGVELAALRAHVGQLPVSTQAALRARLADPEVVAGARCVFLDGDGACAVYAARPILCRTHGPLVFTEDGPSWCALNFATVPPAEVPALIAPGGALALARVDTLLAVVAARYRSQAGGPVRGPLTWALQPEGEAPWDDGQAG